jgi:hypothetical protein
MEENGNGSKGVPWRVVAIACAALVQGLLVLLLTFVWNTINSRMDALNGRMDALSNRMSSEVSASSAQFAQQQTSIAGVSASVGRIEGFIEAMKDK